LIVENSEPGLSAERSTPNASPNPERSTLNASPLGIYVHTPFCPSKCGYCDFNSYAMSGEIMERTTRAQVEEIERSPWRGRPAKTIFFGGGTPTFLSEDQLLRILDAVVRVHPPLEDAEITSEANPGTADAAKFSAMRRAGFNRISLGAQSFLDSDLLRLGRIHKSGEIERAVSIARDAGFENLNLDLMFALPGQSRHAWRANLDRALSLSPEHISLYCLTLEPNTPFYKQHLSGQLQLPDDDEQVAMYNECVSVCAANGYEQYEISNFAKPGYECKHNLCYWHAEEYAGYGPGAVGCVEMDSPPLKEGSGVDELLRPVDGYAVYSVHGAPADHPPSFPPSREGTRKTRYTNLKHPERYGAAVESGDRLAFEAEELTPDLQRMERIMLGLRLNAGLETTGLELASSKVEKMLERGWVELSDSVIRLTAEGRHFCSEVALELI
jgi:oxygen-independent coproporphyrinogen III oxidase